MDNESFIVICPFCGIKNRIQLQKISRKALCSKCGNSLVTDIGKGYEQAVEVNDTNFQNIISYDSGTVLVDFWAPWCGPCRSHAPIINKLASDYAGKVR